MTDGSLETKIDWIQGMKNIRLADLPIFIRTTDPNNILFNFLKDEAQNCLASSGLIINTFTTLEQQVLQAISTFNPNKGALWKENTECLEWLDKKEPKSVVYVNYGSVIKMADKNVQEFARGLANSMHNFLWIVRNDIVGDGSSLVRLFPEEFLEVIKDRGMISSWCPQENVLSHPSVGVFLTHCGWNSVLESLSFGVPLICWPLFAEQSTNCKFACEEWGVGVEISSNVKRDEIEEILGTLWEKEKWG
ncbi:transferase [Lithospermum erythrorhizon]|uniref:Transferase n=1 Tax=Lithospermum erythrorhizon TaxID=34254 RepID=A0AAV3P7M5_LITER